MLGDPGSFHLVEKCKEPEEYLEPTYNDAIPAGDDEVKSLEKQSDREGRLKNCAKVQYKHKEPEEYFIWSIS